MYLWYWNRHQLDPWPFANVREFTKSTTATTNRSLFDVHRTAATPKRISSHLRRQSPLSFTTNCVSAATPTRRRRAQSDLVSISRFFENGTQQLPNILERNIIYSAQSSMVRLNEDALRNAQLSLLSSQQARQSSRDQYLIADSSGGDVVSLNRLSVGCGTTPRRQSGDICRLLFGIRVIYQMLPPHGHCRNIFFYKQLQICISIYFGLI